MIKSRPKVEIGKSFPFWRGDLKRFVNAEVVNCRKSGRRYIWTVALTESQQKVRDANGMAIEFEYPTKWVADQVDYVNGHRQFAPRDGSPYVIRYVLFPGYGLWAEIRSDVACGIGRPTHWDRSEHDTPESLVASGDGYEVFSTRDKRS